MHRLQVQPHVHGFITLKFVGVAGARYGIAMSSVSTETETKQEMVMHSDASAEDKNNGK